MGFKSGKDWNGNSGGRPKNPEREILRQALESAKTKHKGKHLIAVCVENAYNKKTGQKDREIILKKILPDLSESDLSGETLDILKGIIMRAADAQRASG